MFGAYLLTKNLFCNPSVTGEIFIIYVAPSFIEGGVRPD